MKIATIQMNSVSDRAANIAQATTLIESAVAEERPDWLCLPENWNWAGGATADKVANSDDCPGGPAYAAVQALAAKHRVWIHAGSLLERVPGENKVWNTTVVFDRTGKEVARYRKIHLFDIVTPDGMAYRESATVSPMIARASPSAAPSATTSAFRSCSARWPIRARRSSRCRPPSRCRPARTTGRC
jgi:deaminated glutathione amidase